MRFWALVLMALMVFPAVKPAAAGEQSGYSEDFLKLREQVRLNQDVFSKVTQACLAEVYSDKYMTDTRGKFAMDRCIRDKGIDLTRDNERAAPGVTQMGRANATETISYQIPDIGAVMRNLQGGGAEAPARAPQGEGRAENPPQSEQGRENRASSGGQIYLPSKESGGSSKPIFLNR